MLRYLREVPYVPILAVRPSEMKALQELPNSDKNAMLPLVMLRPWVSAYEFESIIERIELAYPDRPWIADFDHKYTQNNEVNSRPVHEKLKELHDPSDSFRNWRQFISETPQAIPCLQIEDNVDVLDGRQVSSLLELNRGLVLRFRQPHLTKISAFQDSLPDVPEDQLLIILDYGQIPSDTLTPADIGVAHIDILIDKFDGVFVVVAGASFRPSFVGISNQEIYERRFFNEISAAHEYDFLIYGDYGSARDERVLGGGRPSPRIDYPLQETWIFERREEDGGYQSAARALVASAEWDDRMRIWGTQMIERTVLGDPHAISSPARATGARINIHLHQQVWYGASSETIYDTEDDWED